VPSQLEGANRHPSALFLSLSLSLLSFLLSTFPLPSCPSLQFLFPFLLFVSDDVTLSFSNAGLWGAMLLSSSSSPPPIQAFLPPYQWSLYPPSRATGGYQRKEGKKPLENSRLAQKTTTAAAATTIAATARQKPHSTCARVPTAF